jgi:hypothetical protein
MAAGDRALSRWLLALAVVLLLAHALSFRFAVDDAYISFRYARNLLDGHGLVFNPGERVEGYSNLSWVLLAAAGMAAGLDPLLWARLLGFAAAAGTVLLMPGLARRLAPPATGAAGAAASATASAPAGATTGPPTLATAAAPLLLAAGGPVACWALGGLETPLFMLLTALAWRAALDRRPLAAGACGVALALTRPEGPLLGGIFALWAALPGEAPAPLWRRGAGLLVLAAGVAAHLLGRHAYYGDWLPNTYYAKTGDLAGQLRTGLPYAGAAALAFVLPWLTAAGWLAARRRAAFWRSVELRRSAALVGLWLLYTAAIGGDMLGMYRFFVPLLPVWLACGAAALAAGTGPARAAGAGDASRASGASGRTAARPAVRRRWPAEATVAVLLGLATLWPSWTGRERWLVATHMSRRNLASWRLAGDGLAQLLPPDTTIALSAVGYIPYRTGFRTYDLLGLTNRPIARRRMEFRKGYAGHEKHDADVILAARPHYLLLGNVDVTDQPRRTPILPYLPETDIFQHPVFHHEYVPVMLRLPSGHYLNCFKYKNLP